MEIQSQISLPRHAARSARMTRSRADALTAFIAKKHEIDELLARLQALSDDHFHEHPDAINWGHVGTLEHYASLLRRITDAAFYEGEFAE